MVRVLACCCLLLFLAGCERDWKHIIVKKRVYLDGYYVHVPSKRETFPADYPPPAQYPVNYPVVSNSRADSSVNRIPVQPDSFIVAYTPPPDTHVQYQQSQQGGGGGFGGGGIAAGGNGGSDTATGIQPHQPDSVPVYAVIQLQDSLVPQTPPDTVYAVQSPPAKPKRAIPQESEMIVQLGTLACQQQRGYRVKWNSFSAGATVRYRVQPLKNKTELVTDAGYRFNQLNISQRQTKFSPLTPQVHDREHISMHAFALTLCVRKNLPEQEKKFYMEWIDAGVYGDWTFASSNVYTDHYDNPAAKKTNTTTRMTGLRYLSKWNYGFTARVGTNYANAFATWRWSRLVRDPSAAEMDGDFPRLTIGVEVCLGNWE